MDHPIICFGQQPCGFFPKRFLFAKILTARRLQKKIGGGEVFRARFRDGKLLLHKGGDRFLQILGGEFGPEQISPTRDTRFQWMQSVIQCTHYVAGASEQRYINKADAPGVKFIERDEISDFDKAYTEL